MPLAAQRKFRYMRKIKLQHPILQPLKSRFIPVIKLYLERKREEGVDQKDSRLLEVCPERIFFLNCGATTFVQQGFYSFRNLSVGEKASQRQYCPFSIVSLSKLQRFSRTNQSHSNNYGEEEIFVQGERRGVGKKREVENKGKFPSFYLQP